MARLRLALLNASHNDENTRRNFRRELDADLVEFDATEGDLPADFDFDGAVVTGSRSSVYWEEPWIEPLEEWVDGAIEAGMPVLGVCFGHQLLADVLDGEVVDMGEYELGYREIEQVGESPLLADVGERFTAFTTHSDTVATLPPGAEPIATNEYGNHGFRKGHVFGVQFHPEYDPETARAITKGKDLPDERIDRVLAGITPESYDAACGAKRLFENFCAYVREVRDVESAPARN